MHSPRNADDGGGVNGVDDGRVPETCRRRTGPLSSGVAVEEQWLSKLET